MPIRKYNPTSPGMRGKTSLTFDEITTNEPYRPLTETLHRSGGRNNQGELTIWWRGGGHKRLYRIIDFKRDKKNIVGRIETVEYDPNRSARIALVSYADGEKRYILQVVGMKVGDTIVASDTADILPGNCLPLKSIPLGTTIHNVELRPGKGGQIARSAGSSVQLVAREGEYASVKMPSGEIRKINVECVATIGQVGNIDHENVSIGKAGRSRWLGKRPHVRGVARTRAVSSFRGAGNRKAPGPRPEASDSH
jgi:large subunit ribosomal protein L2